MFGAKFRQGRDERRRTQEAENGVHILRRKALTRGLATFRVTMVVCENKFHFIGPAQCGLRGDGSIPDLICQRLISVRQRHNDTDTQLICRTKRRDGKYKSGKKDW